MIVVNWGHDGASSDVVSCYHGFNTSSCKIRFDGLCKEQRNGHFGRVK